jgi:hypothetical protein
MNGQDTQEVKYKSISFASLIDEPREGEFRLEGLLWGSVMEEMGVGLKFSISPRLEDTAPMVDGTPRVHVSLPGDFDMDFIQRMSYLKMRNAQVTLEGRYVPKADGDYIGNLEASAFRS